MPDAAAEIRSLLIPLAGAPLLLPTAAVAEVTGYVKPRALPGAPAWLLGDVEWHQRRLPVISVEAAAGDPLPASFGPRARIIILYALKNIEELPFFGIMAHGIPRAYLARRDELLDRTETPETPIIRAGVTLADIGPAVIPDLDQLHDDLCACLPR